MTSERGYTLQRKTADLNFDDTEWVGAKVEVQLDVSNALYLDLIGLGQAAEGGEQSQIAVLLATFAEHVLIGWNLLDDDGEPIPATVEGFRTGSILRFSLFLIKAWMGMVAEVSVPLEVDSPNGSTSDPVPLTPTGASSLNPGS